MTAADAQKDNLHRAQHLNLFVYHRESGPRTHNIQSKQAHSE
jgi:hypothetical protein